MVSLLALKAPLRPRNWGAQGIGIDALHHLMYALGTTVAYELLDRG